MTQKNFVVNNGLTVGNIVLDVATDSITGVATANITTANITTAEVTNANITTANVTNANITMANIGNLNAIITDLGYVSNVTITGGLDSQLLQTDGNGNLSWYTFSPDTGLTCQVDVFTGTGNTAVYTLSIAPVNENFTTVVIDGVTQLRNTYTVVGRTLTIGADLPSNARMEVTTLLGYGNAGLTSTSDLFLGNGNANTYTLTTTPLSIGATTVVIDGIVQMRNSYTLDGANITLNANVPDGQYLEVTTLNGSNYSTANYATYSDIANTANSVVLANVVGIGNIAAVNLTGNVGQVLAGNGTWLNFDNIANANYALFANVANTANSVAGANVTGQVANAAVAGTVYTNAQPNITSLGTLSNLAVTGNTTTGNLSGANLVSANYLTGTLTTNAQPNVTSVGTLSNLAVTGNTTTGNLSGANLVSANFVTGTLTTAAQPNITSVGNLTGLTVGGNATVAGNLTVSGNVSYVNVTNLNVQDPLISLGGGANGDPLTSNDGKDRGTLLEYYTTAPVTAFMGWDNSNGEFALGSNVTVANEVVTYTTLGNLRAHTVLANIAGGSVTGEVANANYASYSNLANTANTVAGANVTGVVANANYSSYSNLANTANSVAGANVTGQVANAAVAGTVYTAAQPNITSLGTLTSLAVTGNVTAGNVTGANLVSANYVTGTLTTAAQPNITSLGTLTGLAVNGTVTAANVTANTGVFTGNGSGLSQLAGANVTGVVANANYAPFSNVANSANSVAVANVVGIGNIATINLTGNTGQVLNGNGGWAEFNNVANANYALYANVANVANAVAGANVTGVVANANYALYANVANVANSVAGANVSGEVANANYSSYSNVANVANSVAGANVSGQVANALVAGTVYTAAQSNITSLGTLTGLAVNGTVTAANITANTGVFTGNGSGLSVLAGANVTGVVANANYAAYANVANAANSVDGANVTGVVANANYAAYANVANTANSVAVANVVGIGNIATINLTGNTGQVLNGNGGWVEFNNVANANYATYANTANTANSVAGANVTGQVANANYALYANIANVAYSVSGSNVSGEVANANYATYSNIANSANSVAGANVSGQVANALVAGTVYTNAQPNITSVGTLSSLSVTGNATVGNLTGANLVSANYFTGTLTTNAQPNITSVGALTDLSVTGNTIVGGNLTVNGNLVYVNAQSLAVEDPIIQLQTGPNGAPLTSNTGRDVGTALNYYDTQARTAFMGWDVSGGEFGLASLASITDEIVTFTQYGNLRAGVIYANGSGLTDITGANVTGQVANANYALYANIANTANSVAGANVTGQVANANYALYANVANVANSVAGANVTGQVANANYALYANIANIANSVAGANVSGEVANANYATYSNTANTANSVAGANVSGQVANALVAGTVYTAAQPNITSVGTLSSLAVTGNITAGNVDGGNIVVANYLTGTLTTAAQANITSVGTLNGLAVNGTVTAANITANTGVFTGNGSGLSALAGANVTGEVANANYAGFSNIANTANLVTWANVSGPVPAVAEFHVARNGNDIIGNGTVLNPYLTISKAVSVVAAGDKIIIHPGGYTEDVTIDNLSTITLSSSDSGGAGPFSPAIYGNVTVSGNSSAVAIKGVGIQKVLTHSATGSLYLTNMQLGGAGEVGTFNKTAGGFLSVADCNWSVTSGANLTVANITGGGTSLFANVAFANLAINNSAASVTVTDGSSTLTTTLSAGTINVFESYMYTLGNSGFFALTSSGGVVNLRNSTLVNPNLTAARVNLSAGTVFSYGDIFFDRANSNLGIQAGTTVDFQALRVANSVSSATLSVTGNANVGNIGATNFVGSGASLTSITGANVTGTVANANVANTAYAVAPANVTQTAWTTYSPSWTASTTNPAIGDGTITGRYQRVGGTVSFSVDILMGTTTTYGTGDWRVSLPANSQSVNTVICTAVLLDNGTRWYNAGAFSAYDGANSYVTLFEGAAPVTATAPFTWTSGDRVIITGTYELA